MDRPLTEQDLPFLEAAEGDLNAKNEIAVRYLPFGVSIARRLGYIPYCFMGDEVRSEVFLTLRLALDDYDPRRASFVRFVEPRIRVALKNAWERKHNGKRSKSGWNRPSVKPLSQIQDAGSGTFEPVFRTYVDMQRRPNPNCVCGAFITDRGNRKKGLCERCARRALRNGQCKVCNAAKFSDGCRTCVGLAASLSIALEGISESSKR